MPNMILRRAFRLASTKGHSVNFEANEPTWVPPVLVPDAIAIGAELVEGDKPDLTPPEPPKANTGPADALAREAEILDAINLLVQRNERGDFSAGGIPHAKAVVELVGYKVDKKELEQVWTKRSELIVAGLLGPNGEKA